MKVLYMGTPDFAVPPLEALIKNHEVTAVVTQPDKPKGRGKKVIYSAVKELALENNIPLLQPEKIKSQDVVDRLKEIEADIFIVAAYGQFLSEEILQIPKYGCVNIHGSLLPKYRGAAPIHLSVINGDSVTGITIMYMDKELDSGDIILKKQIPILDEDTTGTLHDKMSLLGADALIEALEKIQNNNATREKQESSLSTYAPIITKEMGKIDWNKSTKEIINLIRGLNPWPTAYTFYDNEILKIWKGEIISGYTGIAGEIADVINNKGIVVKTKDSSLLITELQALNGKRMSAVDYLRGHKIEIGKSMI